MAYQWEPRRESLAVAGYKIRIDPPLKTGHPRMNLADAVDRNGRRVMLKAISTVTHPQEIIIGQLLSSPTHAVHSENHCLPLLDVLQDPLDSNAQLIVMPLCIPFDCPKFDTVGEVVDCLRQIFEGIQYMHENYIAHRDCNYTNVVQNPDVFPNGDFHPAAPWMDSARQHLSHPITRTECWPRYYIIDFGLSRKYDPSHGPPFEPVILGGDKTPPEHRTSLACNPFPTDIYFLGNLVRGLARPSFCPGRISHAPPHRPLSFLLPLAEQMMRKEPSARPTIGDVVVQFAILCDDLTKAHLRLPARPLRFWEDKLRHRLRQLKRAYSGVPPLPLRTPQTPHPPLSNEMRHFYTQVPKRSKSSSSN